MENENKITKSLNKTDKVNALNGLDDFIQGLNDDNISEFNNSISQNQGEFLFDDIPMQHSKNNSIKHLQTTDDKNSSITDGFTFAIDFSGLTKNNELKNKGSNHLESSNNKESQNKTNYDTNLNKNNNKNNKVNISNNYNTNTKKSKDNDKMINIKDEIENKKDLDVFLSNPISKENSVQSFSNNKNNNNANSTTYKKEEKKKVNGKDKVNNYNNYFKEREREKEKELEGSYGYAYAAKAARKNKEKVKHSKPETPKEKEDFKAVTFRGEDNKTLSNIIKSPNHCQITIKSSEISPICVKKDTPQEELSQIKCPPNIKKLNLESFITANNKVKPKKKKQDGENSEKELSYYELMLKKKQNKIISTEKKTNNKQRLNYVNQLKVHKKNKSCSISDISSISGISYITSVSNNNPELGYNKRKKVSQTSLYQINKSVPKDGNKNNQLTIEFNTISKLDTKRTNPNNSMSNECCSDVEDMLDNVKLRLKKNEKIYIEKEKDLINEIQILREKINQFSLKETNYEIEIEKLKRKKGAGNDVNTSALSYNNNNYNMNNNNNNFNFPNNNYNNNNNNINGTGNYNTNNMSIYQLLQNQPPLNNHRVNQSFSPEKSQQKLPKNLEAFLSNQQKEILETNPTNNNSENIVRYKSFDILYKKFGLNKALFSKTNNDIINDEEEINYEEAFTKYPQLKHFIQMLSDRFNKECKSRLNLEEKTLQILTNDVKTIDNLEKKLKKYTRKEKYNFLMGEDNQKMELNTSKNSIKSAEV